MESIGNIGEILPIPQGNNGYMQGKMSMQTKVIGALGICLVGSILFVGGAFNGILGAQTAIGQPDLTVEQGRVAASGGFCDNGKTMLQGSVKYIDYASANTETLAAVTVAGYKILPDGSRSSSASFSTTSSTSGNTDWNATNCGAYADPLDLIVGTAGTYYYKVVNVPKSKLQGAYTQLDPIIVKLGGAMTASFANETAGTWGRTSNLDNSSNSFRSLQQAGTIRMEAGSYDFGDGALEICALYNTTDITDLKIGGLPIIPSDGSVTPVAGRGLRCFEWIGDMRESKRVELPIYVNGGTDGILGGHNISILFNDKTKYLKNGQLLNAYTNIDTPTTDLGETLVRYDGAFNISSST